MCMYKYFAIELFAKLAKLLSKWRTPVIQDGAEFCIRSIVKNLAEVVTGGNTYTIRGHFNCQSVLV